MVPGAWCRVVPGAWCRVAAGASVVGVVAEQVHALEEAWGWCMVAAWG